MPELTIELRCDPATGKRDIVVRLQKDGDLLPVEHEQLHRKMVEQLIEGGLLKAGEAGRLLVEREGGERVVEPSAEPTADERKALGEGR